MSGKKQDYGVPELAKLKDRAWALKKAEGISHHEALDRIASEYGHKNWAMLVLNLRKERTS